jgi:hypothetical protein
MTPTTEAVLEAKSDAVLFADEFPGETLDPAATDWDASAWQMSDLSKRDDADALWPVYQAALVVEVARLAYVATFATLAEAVAYENATLSIGREFLPGFALAVLDGGEDTAEYWAWLTESAEQAEQEAAAAEVAS